MKDKNNKKEDQEILLDHIIEYGGKQYIHDEIEKEENIPEKELPDEFNQRMDKMFQEAYRKESLRERLRAGKKVAAIAVVVLGITTVTVMNVKAFREPVLNFIFKMNGTKNKTKVRVEDASKKKQSFSFNYLPDGYKYVKKWHLYADSQIVYEFQNKKKQHLYINIQLNQTQEAYNDISKNDPYTEITKNNNTYYFLPGKNNTLLFYKDHTIFTIIAKEADLELIKVAENIN